MGLALSVANRLAARRFKPGAPSFTWALSRAAPFGCSIAPHPSAPASEIILSAFTPSRAGEQHIRQMLPVYCPSPLSRRASLCINVHKVMCNGMRWAEAPVVLRPVDHSPLLVMSPHCSCLGPLAGHHRFRPSRFDRIVKATYPPFRQQRLDGLDG